MQIWGAHPLWLLPWVSGTSPEVHKPFCLTFSHPMLSQTSHASRGKPQKTGSPSAAPFLESQIPSKLLLASSCSSGPENDTFLKYLV